MRGSVQRDTTTELRQDTVRHILDVDSLQPEEVRTILDLARAIKRGEYRGDVLRGRYLALVFEKPSLRTRVSFEAAVHRLGGAFSYMSGSDVGLGTRETIADFARTIDRYVDGLIVRVYVHQTVEELARYMTSPVINALSDEAHPCQALADALTILERFGSKRPAVVFMGDGNNVARSLAVVCRYLGWRFRLCCPPRYAFPASFLDHISELGGGGEVSICHDPAEAIRDADVIYTDVWVSMGQEKEGLARRRSFRRYQVNEALLEKAPAHAIVMHCLPARRGEEITDEVLEGPRSVVFDQAENRLHAQQALLAWIYGRTDAQTSAAQGT